MAQAEQHTEDPAAGGQRREREIEVEEIHPGHLDYRDGRGREFHVWTVTRAGAGSKFGLGKLSEAQLRELGRQISHLLGPAAGPEGDHGPGTPRCGADAGPAPEIPASADAVTSDDARGAISREGTGSGGAAGDRPAVRHRVH